MKIDFELNNSGKYRCSLEFLKLKIEKNGGENYIIELNSGNKPNGITLDD